MSIEGRLPFVDALFTATSAVCVTGLTVVDTGTHFSRVGQWVILVLLQIGGLGIFTFSTFFMVLLRGETTLRGRLVIQEAMTHFPHRNLMLLLRNILLFTFGAEAVGTLLLWLAFRERLGGPTALYYSIFHSVSSFCNAGFSLWSTSFEEYAGNAPVCLTVMALIILGGLGFTVVTEVGVRMIPKRQEFRRLSLNSRVVLTTSAALITSGALLFYLLEHGNSLAVRPLPEQILASFFQSITARTAGFNTIRIGELTSATLFILIILMFIGASPGSTGGGIKTTTFTIYLVVIASYLRGKESANIFGRTIPTPIASKALATIAAGFLLVIVSTVLIVILEGRNGDPASRESFLPCLFEAVSAFGTVGLSTGITPLLEPLSKFVIVATMFAGRVGPLALALSLLGRGAEQRFRYPEENVMIG